MPDIEYRISGTIYMGEMSVIYKATGPDNEILAIKSPQPEFRTRRLIKQMEREARICMQFEHPNIVRVYGFQRQPNPGLVMEYFRSKNLKSWILAKDKFIQEQAFNVIWQTGQALAYIHEQSIVHRDVKPANILVSDSAEVRLVDFTICEELGTSWRRVFRGRLPISGTRTYIAPETIRRQPVDGRTDIYSFGTTIYEMLTGKPPFVSADRDELLRMHIRAEVTHMRNVNPRISKAFDALVLRMLEKSPDKRPPSMAVVLDELTNTPLFDEQK